MTLLNSRAAGGRCIVCGSPDSSCGGLHAQSGASPVTVPGEGVREAPATLIAERYLNGSKTQVLSTEEEVEREGWNVVRRLDGKPFHKKRPAPESPKPETPEPAAPAPEPEPEPAEPEEVSDGKAPTVKELRARAKALDIRGRSTMSKAELLRAVTSAEKKTSTEV